MEQVPIDRRTVARDSVLANIVSYLRALPEAKQQLLMNELAQQWDQSQAAMLAQSQAEAARY